MKENIKVGDKWVYVKCTKCGKKKDFSRAAFDKKIGGDITPEQFASDFICASCSKPKSKSEERRIEIQSKPEDITTPFTSDGNTTPPVVVAKDFKPYTKERQLGKKEKRISPIEEDNEMFFAK